MFTFFNAKRSGPDRSFILIAKWATSSLFVWGVASSNDCRSFTSKKPKTISSELFLTSSKETEFLPFILACTSFGFCFWRKLHNFHTDTYLVDGIKQFFCFKTLLNTFKLVFKKKSEFSSSGSGSLKRKKMKTSTPWFVLFLNRNSVKIIAIPQSHLRIAQSEPKKKIQSRYHRQRELQSSDNLKVLR